jgi:hypothetical protein
MWKKRTAADISIERITNTRECRECAAVKPLAAFREHARTCRVCNNLKQNQRPKTLATRRYLWLYHIQKNYGLSEAAWEVLLVSHSGRCGACGRALMEGRGQDGGHIDHNHETGEVRGILCAGCNNALGFADEDPALLRALAHYLEMAQTPKLFVVS